MGAADEVEPLSLPAATTPTALIVEDDPLTRLVAAELMREAGLTVVEAMSGDEAWRYIQSGGRVDLLFTDIHMPGQIDGRELASLIRREFPQVKVIVASGNPGPSMGVEFPNFLRKPYDFGQATQLILKLLGRDPRDSSDNPPRTG